jgi:hypothetical protein
MAIANTVRSSPAGFAHRAVRTAAQPTAPEQENKSGLDDADHRIVGTRIARVVLKPAIAFVAKHKPPGDPIDGV